MLWRHGDVLISSTDAIPAGAKPVPGTVLAYGEITGHSHRVEDPSTAELWQVNGQLYLKVTDPARLIHEEHAPIALDPGVYRVWMQREYTPRAIVTVRD